MCGCEEGAQRLPVLLCPTMPAQPACKHVCLQPHTPYPTPPSHPRQVIYSHAQACALHHAPLFIVLLLPLLAKADDEQQLTWGGLLGATLMALASLLCALALPAAVGAGRALASGRVSRQGRVPPLLSLCELPGAAYRPG